MIEMTEKKLIDRLLSDLEGKCRTIAVPEGEKAETAGEPTLRQQVLDALLKRCKAANMDDLPRIEKEMQSFFEEYTNADYFADYQSKEYYRFLDLREESDARVVVLGDVHCDFFSLAALLLKLSVSSYDYFGKARFVFLGDYLDRGMVMFEPLLLLMDLRRILGERMIMLKGNHELISYGEVTGKLDSQVLPQDSCPLMNQLYGKEKAFLKQFGDFFRTLPTYVYLKVAGRNVLLTHAAVPRDIFRDTFHFDQENGAFVFEPAFLYEQKNKAQERTFDDSLKTMNAILNDDLLRMRNQIFFDMIWGDPCHAPSKFQVAGRYQFGSEQFDAYARKNRIDLLLRSHVPVRDGFESFFDDRLYTIFTSGGAGNEQAGYGNITPAFAVVCGDGRFFMENSYLYRVRISDAFDFFCNPFTGDVLKASSVSRYCLGDEFICDERAISEVESLFVQVKDGFVEMPEEPKEPEEEPVKPEASEKPEEPGESPKVDETPEKSAEEAPELKKVEEDVKIEDDKEVL